MKKNDNSNAENLSVYLEDARPLHKVRSLAAHVIEANCCASECGTGEHVGASQFCGAKCSGLISVAPEQYQRRMVPADH